MTVDMQMLIATGILAFFHPAPYLVAYLKYWEPKVAFGNRHNTPELPLWAERALRAHHNMTENFAHFAVFVLAVNYLDLSNNLTALGATLFFWCRLAFLVVYTAGIPWIRSVIFIGALTGEGMIAYQLVTAGFQLTAAG